MNNRRYLYILIILSAVIRAFVAGSVELTNDESNYFLYALYPDISHFDHPPMVGYFIQLFSLNFFYKSEFLLRMSAVVTGTLNTIIVYRTGKLIKDETAGLLCAVIYNTSIYAFIICGVFAMPDTPLSLFWLLAMYFFIKAFIRKKNLNNNLNQLRVNLLLGGLFTGLAFLSKFTAVFLWLGVILYVLFYNRNILKTKEMYISVIITALFSIPVIVWNYRNDFISFAFQSERADIFKSGIRFDYFFTELEGQFIYNNPVNIIIIISCIIFYFRNKTLFKEKIFKLLFFFTISVYLFLVISLFRKTLPHWACPGYFGFILFTGVVLREKFNRFFETGFRLPASLKAAIVFLLLFITIGYLQINHGIIPGKNDDVSLDMYGWKSFAVEFENIYRNDLSSGKITGKPSILTFRWFPAGHIDFYAAHKMGLSVYAVGNMNAVRNYFFVNQKRGAPPLGSDAYYICLGNDFKNPSEIFKTNYSNISAPDTVCLNRGGKPAKEYFVFRLKTLIKPFSYGY